MTQPSCAFCDIIRGADSDVREVYRDEHVVAFFPTSPATLGHTLLVPRRHVPDVWTLTDGEAAQLSNSSLRLAQAIRDAVVPDGLNIIQSNGQAATQTVDHLHVHLVPRWAGDAMGPIWPADTNFSDAQKNDVLARVRTAAERINQEGANLPTVSPDDRRKHLDYIQAVVTRMSAASSAAKGWLLPVVTATYGYALTKQSWPVATLGIVAVLLFAYIDANYLNTERRFRQLYDTVARSRRVVPVFSLDPADAHDPPPSPGSDGPPDRKLVQAWRRIKSWIPEREVWLSWSVMPFYLSLAVTGVGIIAFSACATETPQTLGPAPVEKVQVPPATNPSKAAPPSTTMATPTAAPTLSPSPSN